MQVFHPPHVLLYAVSIAGVAAIAMAQESPTDDVSPSHTTTTIIPGTGDVDFVEVQKACPCPDGDRQYLGVNLLTPVQMRVTAQPRGINIRAIVENCSSEPQRWKVNYEYETRHEAGAHASGSVTVGTEVATGGLLSSVIAEGKVDVEVGGEVGGSYDCAKTKVHGEELMYAIPECAGLFIATYYIDYRAEAHQYEVDHVCCRTVEFVDIDGTIMESCDECYEIVASITAHGDGDAWHVHRLQEFHPCTVGCVTTSKNPVSLREAVATLQAEVDSWEDGIPRSWAPTLTRDAGETTAQGGR